MNGCKEVNFSFTPGSYFAGDTCNIIDNPNSNYTSSYYLNLSKFNYERTSSATGGAIRICKYDMNKEPLGMVYNSLDNTIGEFSVDLDPNYLYRISYYSGRFSNLKGIIVPISSRKVNLPKASSFAILPIPTLH